MTAVLQPSGATAVLPALHSDVELLTVTTRQILSGAIVLTVHGEVDSSTSQPLQDALLAHLRSTGPPLIIDLTDVSFLGAAGLTVLVTVRDAAVASRVRLCVVAHTRPVLRPLDGVFDIYPDIARAMVRLGGGPDG